MAKDRVVIAVIATVVLSAILFGIFMAYKIYRAPMYVEDIKQEIKMLMDDSDNEEIRMYKLSLYYELSRSCTMKDRNTNEIRHFTKSEMDEIYKKIGGKEAVINYLSSIKDKEERRKKLETACYQLKIITDDELVELWNLNNEEKR